MRNFIKAAAEAGWEVPENPTYGPNQALTVARGDERIVIEIGPGGIPRTVRRTTHDGRTLILSQNYIRMAEVLGWLGKGAPSPPEPEPKKAPAKKRAPRKKAVAKKAAPQRESPSDHEG